MHICDPRGEVDQGKMVPKSNDSGVGARDALQSSIEREGKVVDAGDCYSNIVIVNMGSSGVPPDANCMEIGVSRFPTAESEYCTEYSIH